MFLWRNKHLIFFLLSTLTWRPKKKNVTAISNFIFYLKIKRLQTYTHLIQSRLVSHPELKPTLVETSIGEDDEFPHAVKPLDGGQKKSPVQRSISDRYSYRAAIYQSERVNLEMI